MKKQNTDVQYLKNHAFLAEVVQKYRAFRYAVSE